MTAFLPQYDPNPSDREQELANHQNRYQYNYQYVSPLAMVDRVPVKDEFTLHWVSEVTDRIKTLAANHASVEIETRIAKAWRKTLECFQTRLFAGHGKIRQLREIVGDALRFDGRIGAPAEHGEEIDAYMELFNTVGLPPVANDYQKDEVFAEMRVGGPNSVMLMRVNAISDFLGKFPVSEKDFSVAHPDDSMEAAVAEGRLYWVDFAPLKDVEWGSFPHGQKYLYAPMALFVVTKSTRRLMPVAIQCQQEPDEKNPIFTPKDGWNWMIAKTIVEIADGNVHEAVSHLGRTHLFMEPFVVSTYRQLAPSHPMNKLLAPHFHGTLAINDAAWRFLIANEGGVDKLCGGTIDESRRFAVEGVQSYPFNEAFLPDQFKRRGVDDTDALPHYPYRDDAMLYWDAIEKWVKNYVGEYYTKESDIAEDAELQKWCDELISQDGGRVVGFGENGNIETKDYLTRAATLMIYTASAQHAAVNFPQFDLMSYVPNMPLAGYQPAPESKTGATEQDYLAMLPPLDMAELQMDLGYMLGTVHYTTLGQYGARYFQNQTVNQHMKSFQGELSGIGKTIKQRNLERRPYNFLLPKGVPQSINI